MIIRENEPLAERTTFGVNVRAAWFVELTSVEDVERWAKEVSRQPQFTGKPTLPLGGGSNILFTRDFEGIVLNLSLSGCETTKLNQSQYLLRLGAGEVWHETVASCVERGLYGIENLALIPGNAGAAPMQNIGAYGVEFADVLHSVEFYDLKEQKLTTLPREKCQLGYRTSVFKSELKSRCIITSVTLALSAHPAPVTSYADVAKELENRGIVQPTPRDVFDVVVSVRTRKLPDPKRIGNAGSFFKNPVVSAESAIFAQFPEIPVYPQRDGAVKIPAAWLIERCGWKGFRRGDAGVSPTQALVLVNYGNATGAEIAALSEEIQLSVAQKFGIHLEPEVNIIR